MDALYEVSLPGLIVTKKNEWCDILKPVIPLRKKTPDRVKVLDEVDFYAFFFLI